IECALGSEVEKLDIIKAVNLIAECWNQVITKTTSNCFAHTGIFPFDQELKLHENPPDLKEVEDEINVLAKNLEIFQQHTTKEVMTVQDYLDIDNCIDTIEGGTTNIKTLVER
ncbi:hypothetical protein HK096_010031, partial [Nowakowskiella sp. JEL0078]